MTLEEALERTVNYIERQTKDERFYSSKDENLDFAETIKKALEKQMPKKPIKYKYEIVCPSCKTLVGSSPYCRYCGQALDWG